MPVLKHQLSRLKRRPYATGRPERERPEDRLERERPEEKANDPR